MVQLVQAWFESSEQDKFNISSIIVLSYTSYFGPPAVWSHLMDQSGTMAMAPTNQGCFGGTQLCGQFQSDKLSDPS